MADAMTEQRLAHTKSAAEDGVFADLALSCHRDAAHDRGPRLPEVAAREVLAPRPQARGAAERQASPPARSYSGRKPADECRRLPGVQPPPKPRPHHLYGSVRAYSFSLPQAGGTADGRGCCPCCSYGPFCLLHMHQICGSTPI